MHVGSPGTFKSGSLGLTMRCPETGADSIWVIKKMFTKSEET
jgi:hypothetical protein